MEITLFQSHLGLISTGYSAFHSRFGENFNPILVWFQHIKIEEVWRHEGGVFQSHLGLISTTSPIPQMWVWVIHFNPILVWFQHTSAYSSAYTPYCISIPSWSDFNPFRHSRISGGAEGQFQSHLGLISTYSSNNIHYRTSQHYFNPILVWFQQYTYYQQGGEEEEISIPSWSDFNWEGNRFPCCNCLISIPSWSDFNWDCVFSMWEVVKKFQSHLGLISTAKSYTSMREQKLISIPSWSDFNKITSCVSSYRTRNISIPSWSDFNSSGIWQRKDGRFIFQSHLGLISTGGRTDKRPNTIRFQSHLGLISTFERGVSHS